MPVTRNSYGHVFFMFSENMKGNGIKRDFYGFVGLKNKFSMKGNDMALNRELLDILACPQCKGDIRLNEAEEGLICDRCKLLYHIKDDIPVMLIDEATPLDQ